MQSFDSWGFPPNELKNLRSKEDLRSKLQNLRKSVLQSCCLTLNIFRTGKSEQLRKSLAEEGNLDTLYKWIKVCQVAERLNQKCYTEDGTQSKKEDSDDS
jgi:hypothetical protein